MAPAGGRNRPRRACPSMLRCDSPPAMAKGISIIVGDGSSSGVERLPGYSLIKTDLLRSIQLLRTMDAE